MSITNTFSQHSTLAVASIFYQQQFVTGVGVLQSWYIIRILHQNAVYFTLVYVTSLISTVTFIQCLFLLLQTHIYIYTSVISIKHTFSQHLTLAVSDHAISVSGVIVLNIYQQQFVEEFVVL